MFNNELNDQIYMKQEADNVGCTSLRRIFLEERHVKEASKRFREIKNDLDDCK